jgi:ABC-2 type transport system ATP-binding protein
MAKVEARIEVSGVHKRFGPTVALDGMTFTVLPGKVNPVRAGPSAVLSVTPVAA